jgi:hypothetical protein
MHKHLTFGGPEIILAHPLINQQPQAFIEIERSPTISKISPGPTKTDRAVHVAVDAIETAAGDS